MAISATVHIDLDFIRRQMGDEAFIAFLISAIDANQIIEEYKRRFGLGVSGDSREAV